MGDGNNGLREVKYRFASASARDGDGDGDGVREEARRRRLASQLVKRASARITSADCSSVFLDRQRPSMRPLRRTPPLMVAYTGKDCASRRTPLHHSLAALSQGSPLADHRYNPFDASTDKLSNPLPKAAQLPFLLL